MVLERTRLMARTCQHQLDSEPLGALSRSCGAAAVGTVVEHVLRHGKYQLSPAVVAEVRAVRAARREDEVAAAVLDCVLDKAEGRYSYRSYLALEVLAPLLPAPGWTNATDRLIPLLLTDLVRFESAAAEGDRLPVGRPDDKLRQQRIAKAGRLIRTFTARYQLPLTASPEEELRVASSVLPVSRRHDEYLFIRVLQCYESTFMTVVLLLERALAAANADEVGTVADRVEEAAALLEETSGLFSLLATMPPENFHGFRLQTVGSSAIQSSAYKAFELLCAVPPPERLASAAFGAVPELQAYALAGPASLAGWYRTGTAALTEQKERVVTAFQALEQAHQRWKRTHYSLSRKMIGDAAGTGGTEGVEYLRACQDNRLFWTLREFGGAAEAVHPPVTGR